MRIQFFLLFLGLGHTLSAQTSLSAFSSHTVAISVDQGRSQGAGFIVGRNADSTFIATATHVLRAGDTISHRILVTGQDGIHRPATLLYWRTAPPISDDVALLSVPGYWVDTPARLHAIPSRIGMPLLFFNQQGAHPQTFRPSQSIDRFEDQDHQVVGAHLLVSDGDSGSAVFSPDGITGMIIRKSRQLSDIINIDHIRQIICNWDTHCWQLSTLKNTEPITP